MGLGQAMEQAKPPFFWYRGVRYEPKIQLVGFDAVVHAHAASLLPVPAQGYDQVLEPDPGVRDRVTVDV